MPLSSSSLPSLGGSKLDDMASANLWRFAAFSASLDPNWAGGNERNMRPKRPWNDGDFGVDMSPRRVALCFALMRLFGSSSIKAPPGERNHSDCRGQCRHPNLERRCTRRQAVLPRYRLRSHPAEPGNSPAVDKAEALESQRCSLC